jgi:hypothetical protein
MPPTLPATVGSACACQELSGCRIHAVAAELPFVPNTGHAERIDAARVARAETHDAQLLVVHPRDGPGLGVPALPTTCKRSFPLPTL